MTAQHYTQDSSPLPEALPTLKVTTSYWEVWGTYKRGTVDLNTLIPGGSVNRYNGVTYEDPDWLAMPFWAHEQLYEGGRGQNIYVPKR